MPWRKSCTTNKFASLSGLGLILAAIALAPRSFALEPADYEWIRVTNKAEFAPRDGAGALVFKDRMWLLGGWNPSDPLNFPRKCSNDVWSSANGAEWSRVRPNTYGTDRFDPNAEWEGRHTAGYAVLNGKMWIIGGDPLQGHYQYDVWNSEDGKNWRRVNKDHDVPWGPRILNYTVTFQNKIWVMGGQTTPQFAPADELFYDDVWNTADGVHWNKVEPKRPHWPPRGMIGGSVVFNGRIWILGGGTYDTPETPERTFYNDVWSTSDGIHWKRHVENAPWHPRQYHEVAVFDGRMWILEGWNTGNRNDVWYSSDGVNWRELPNTPWAPRHAASAFVYDDSLWIVAGNNMESDVWKLRRKEQPVR